jgi:sterol desaturase/sphingolipid hydroxylase (fatty acid hydroxylase superfamily)
VDSLKALGQLPPSFYLMLGAFAVVAGWEGLRPALSQTVSTPLRWFNNFLWLALDTLVLRIVFPVLSVAWAATVADRGWGMLSWIDLPIAMVFVIGLVCMDIAGYGLHLLLHKSSLLWRLHAIHHSDIDFDCTTGFRFHPLEGMVSTAVRLAVITAMGIPASVAAAYEFWIVLQNLYGHANVSLPARIEKILRWVVVTPDMHRVHHSARASESLRNYGIVFPWWDRVFGTYLAEPKGGHPRMTIGLSWRRQESLLSVPKLLLLPFATAFPSARELDAKRVSETLGMGRGEAR